MQFIIKNVILVFIATMSEFDLIFNEDYVLYICSFLTIDDIKNLRLMSSYFNNMCVKKINKIDSDILEKEIINDDVILNHKNFFSNMTEFFYFGNPSLTIKGMKALCNLKILNFASGDKEVEDLSELSTIEEIDICSGGAGKLYYDKIKYLNLKKFHMYHTYIMKEDKLFHHKFKNLMELTLLFSNNIPYETQNNYVQLLSKTIQLKYLKLKTPFDIDLNNFTTLSHLVISSSGISNKSIDNLSQLKMLNIKRNDISCIKNLKNLEIYHGNYLDFTNQNKLKSLYLFGGSKRPNQVDTKTSMLSLRTSIKSIEVLKIYCDEAEVVDCDAISDMINLIDLSILFSSNLMKLDVSKLTKLKCIDVENIILEGILSSSLKEIKVKLSDENSQKMCLLNSKNLQKVYVKGMSIQNLGNNIRELENDNKLTKKDVKMLKNNNLTYLCVSDKSNINSSIINNNFYGLVTLKIDSIESKIIFLNNLRKLRVLKLCDCDVEPNCIANLELIELDLSHINVHLNINPTKLEKLYVRKCPMQKIILSDLIKIKEICCNDEWAKNNIVGYNELSEEKRDLIFPIWGTYLDHFLLIKNLFI